jgi:valyl-tRNA synthetase
MARVQSAAATFRRSGALVRLVGEERRIFDAVVKPRSEPAGEADGAVRAECERLGKEIERAERMLANDRFVANAPSEVVEAERQKLERYRAARDALGC